jgi:hypothetical protein
MAGQTQQEIIIKATQPYMASEAMKLPKGISTRKWRSNGPNYLELNSHPVWTPTQWTHTPIDPAPLIETNSGDLKAAPPPPKKILKYNTKKGAVTPVTSKAILLGIALLRPSLIKARSKHTVPQPKSIVLTKNLRLSRQKVASEL